MAKQIEINEKMIGEICDLLYEFFKGHFPEWGIRKDCYRICMNIATLGKDTEEGRRLAAWLNDPKIRAEVW